MQYQKPGFIMKLASAEFDNGTVGTNYLLKMRAESNQWLLQNIASNPNQQQLADANRYIQKISGLLLEENELKEILALFPLVRIELAVYSSEKIDVQDNLLDAISNYFLGCTWPRIGDNVNLDKFISLLKHQAVAMGYNAVPDETRSKSVHKPLITAYQLPGCLVISFTQQLCCINKMSHLIWQT